MLHIYRHKNGKLKGKFDIALVVKGKYIMGSNQGYNRKLSAIKAIKSLLHKSGDWTYILFQDDTECAAYSVSPSMVILIHPSIKLSKPYIPQSKK